jgi:hypothetical protein
LRTWFRKPLLREAPHREVEPRGLSGERKATVGAWLGSVTRSTSHNPLDDSDPTEQFHGSNVRPEPTASIRAVADSNKEF